MLREFLLRARDRRQRGVEHDGARRGGALVDGEEIVRHADPPRRRGTRETRSRSVLRARDQSTPDARGCDDQSRNLYGRRSIDRGFVAAWRRSPPAGSVRARRPRACSSRACAAPARNSRRAAPWRAAWSAPRRCAACSAPLDTGLSRNSCTPSRTASSTRERSPWPVSMMIGTSGYGKRPGRAHPAHELGAVHARHLPVEQHDVGRDARGSLRARSRRRWLRGSS